MNFSEALVHLRRGEKISRISWDSTIRPFLYLVPGSNFEVNRAPLLGIFEEGTDIAYRPHIDIRNPDNTFGIWDCPQSDVLAEDWEIYRGDSKDGND